MTSRDFCYWLQGWFELNETIDRRDGASKETLEMIKKHLSLVFYHEIDPSYTKDQNKQQEMNKIHNGLPQTEEEAVSFFGAKPSSGHEFNHTGWYDPTYGIPRC